MPEKVDQYTLPETITPHSFDADFTSSLLTSAKPTRSRRMRHHRPVHHHENSHEQAAEKTQQFCPQSLYGGTTRFSPLDRGELMADPLYRSLSAKAPSSTQFDHFSKNFGCIEISRGNNHRNERTDHSHSLPRIPSVENMITQSRILNRVASGDPQAPDFEIREGSEHEFKQNYAKELLRIKDKVAPNLSDAELARFTKNVYKVEDPNGTYDTQAGTPQKYADSENPEANKWQRRNNSHPASSGVGYCQIITPTNLRLMISDNGNIPASMRTDVEHLRKDSLADTTNEADKLEKKAELLEALQTKIRAEIVAFGEQNKNNKSYFDGKGNPTEALYTDFSHSNTKTKLGVSGRELAVGMQGLLMDADIGPKVQAKQLAEDQRDATGKAAQEYFKTAEQGWQKATEKWEALSAPEQKRLITSYISKLGKNNISPETRELLEMRANDLTDGRAKDSPPATDPDTCDAVLKAHNTQQRDESVPQVLKGYFCSSKDALNRALPALGQMFNNWGSGTGTKMLDQHGASTKSLISPEALRANGIARGVNSDGLIERITNIQSRPDDFGSREFESIFKDMSGVNYYGHKQK